MSGTVFKAFHLPFKLILSRSQAYECFVSYCNVFLVVRSKVHLNMRTVP